MFQRIRAALFPVYGREWKKFLPLLFILSCVCFNYSLLRNLKDSLVITASGSGAEVLPFLKLWGILPGAIFMTFLFTRLSNRFTQSQVFTIVTLSFLFYFCVFSLFIYPNHEYLHPHAFADTLEATLPVGMKGLVAMIRNWTFTSFYVIAEMWATFLLTVMVWGFANQISTVAEASRFYGILHMGSNIATAFSGQVGILGTQTVLNPALPFGSSAWEQTLIILVTLVTLSGLAALGMYHWMQRNVVNDPELCPQKAVGLKKKHLNLSIVYGRAYLI